MYSMKNFDKLIFHVDVNSAYLSWEAAYRMQHGEKVDLREITSVVGGDEESRHGIVLAKSIPAKKYKIATGEPLFSARQKCPELIIAHLYMQCSNALNEILQQYTPKIQRFYVDESFLDLNDMQHLYPDYMKLAEEIKERIKKELGFTVNIGISSNKLLAKVASDFEKPDNIHTLFISVLKTPAILKKLCRRGSLEARKKDKILELNRWLLLVAKPPISRDKIEL
jgi:DNA polymerase-4